MERVTIVRASVAHPEHRITQEEAARRIGAATGEPRRAAALARGTEIRERATCIPSSRSRASGPLPSETWSTRCTLRPSPWRRRPLP